MTSEFYTDEDFEQAETVAAKLRSLNMTAFRLGTQVAEAHLVIEAKQQEIQEAHLTLGRVQDTVKELLE